MQTLTTEERIQQLQRKLGEVVTIHHLNIEKYTAEAHKGMPQENSYQPDREKVVSRYIDNLCRTIVDAMVEAKLDVRVELPKLRDAGLMAPDYFIFGVMANFDPEQSKRCHAHLVTESTNLIQ